MEIVSIHIYASTFLTRMDYMKALRPLILQSVSPHKTGSWHISKCIQTRILKLEMLIEDG